MARAASREPGWPLPPPEEAPWPGAWTVVAGQRAKLGRSGGMTARLSGSPLGCGADNALASGGPRALSPEGSGGYPPIPTVRGHPWSCTPAACGQAVLSGLGALCGAGQPPARKTGKDVSNTSNQDIACRAAWHHDRTHPDRGRRGRRAGGPDRRSVLGRRPTRHQAQEDAASREACETPPEDAPGREHCPGAGWSPATARLPGSHKWRQLTMSPHIISHQQHGTSDR